MTKLVVKKHRPLEIFLYCLIISVVISVIVWLSLDANHWSVIKSRFVRGQEAKELWQANRKLETENQTLKDRVLMLERLTNLDEKTATQLQKEIRNLQDQVYSLTGELEFYQGIMSSTANSKGLNIQGLHIEPTDQTGLYRYKLILTNVAKNANIIRVSFDISIEGMDGPTTRVLSLKDVKTANAPDQTISFKNFEKVEGSFSFPSGFKPLRVVVDLKQKGVSGTSVQRVFDWPVVAG
jgi:cell division protein FtsB